MGRVSSKAGRAAGEATSDACSGMSAVGTETLGPVNSWGQMGDSGGQDMVNFLGWVGLRIQSGVTLSPSEAHKGLLPLSQPLPPPLSSSLSSPPPVPQPLAYEPPLSWHLPF